MARRKSPYIPPHGFDFDRRQAAEYIGETISTLNAWATHRPAKNLPFIIAANRAWYRKADLDAYLRNKLVKARVA